jgi:GST-like protein
MITLYGGPTTNTHKITIALEELGLAYKEHYLSLPNKEQLQPWFINLRGKSPF